MGSFWTFLVIIGVVVIKYFGELATNKEANQPTAPTDEEKSDIEKRIQEILGEVEQKRVAPQPATPKTVTPTPQPVAPRPAARPARPKVKAQPAYTSLEQITPELAMSSHRFNKQTPLRSTSTPKKVQPTPTEAAGKSELDTMIEDFTIEKAVIYSEILEPKFKQF